MDNLFGISITVSDKISKTKLGTKCSEYPDENSPEKLYYICLQFIVKNITSVESLNNFPGTIGENMFKEVIKSDLFLSSDQTLQIKVIELFSTAYNSDMLSSLSLSHQLIVINEFLDPIMKLSVHIYALDLSFCYLGDEHELIQFIGELKSLKQLSLRKNCLTDHAVRKLTLPARMFGLGIKCLEFLDVSDNIKITDKSLPWLSKLTKLSTLILTGTGVSDTAVQILSKNLDLLLSIDHCASSIQTIGWAVPVINQWIDLCQKVISSKKPLNKSGLFNFYHSKKVESKYILQELCEQQVQDHEHHLIILKKNPTLAESSKIQPSKSRSSTLTNPKSPVTKRLKKIEDDLFAQYI